ncbi:ABC transporter permease [Falsibacillus pallidus]|uniref:ABC-2 type transport system permease protein n=1 Tax=Falsibacillus pallidus TaxID=493781 RepID=A0A370GX70_9BACI|nr:ABC transporter permease [Falsibacillus pallidus]RDI47866.1 ABC-2 type transport system permease protein [Falsibacillus pallidus]
MKEINRLWTDRSRENHKELRKYLRYMLNDHLLFVVIFGIGGGAFYYQKWVHSLDGNFPVALMMALILGLAATISPIQTLLKEADQVFLIQIETKMNAYFHKGIWTSFLSQSYVLLILSAVLMPIYAQVKGNGFSFFFLLLLVLLLMKIWNLYIRWYVLKFQEMEYSRLDFWVRLALNAVLLFLLVDGAPIYLIGLIGVIYILLLAYFSKAAGKKLIKWDKLIRMEEQRMMAFYRTANLFTDVPKLKGEVKRRKWLDWLFQFSAYGRENSYWHLFFRTFIRNSEYFGLFIRLSVIGALLIFFSTNLYLIIGLAFLFVYLTGIQLIPLMGSQDHKLWIHIYPLKKEWKTKSFLKLMQYILSAEMILFFAAEAVKGEWTNSVILAAAGILFVIIFVRAYIPSRLKKMNH